MDECRDKLKAAFSADISARDYAIDQVGDFARHQAVQQAMLDAFDAMERHNMDKAEELMTKAFQVGPHADSAPYDYWDEVDSRTKYRVDVKSGKIKPHGMSTGIPELDKVLYHKGWGIKELTVLLAGAKKGKSFSLWDFGKLLTLQGRNVLGVTLEVSKEVLSDRLDASVSDTEIDAIGSHILAIRDEIKKTKEKRDPGKFMLHEFPSGSFRPLDLENLIETYKARGIKFDAVVIDYLDIMRLTSGHPMRSRTLELYGLIPAPSLNVKKWQSYLRPRPTVRVTSRSRPKLNTPQKTSTKSELLTWLSLSTPLKKKWRRARLACSLQRHVTRKANLRCVSVVT